MKGCSFFILHSLPHLNRTIFIPEPTWQPFHPFPLDFAQRKGHPGCCTTRNPKENPLQNLPGKGFLLLGHKKGLGPFAPTWKAHTEHLLLKMLHLKLQTWNCLGIWHFLHPHKHIQGIKCRVLKFGYSNAVLVVPLDTPKSTATLQKMQSNFHPQSPLPFHFAVLGSS